jgi:hypothetical protein
VPEPDGEVMDGLCNGLLQGISIDLDLVPDPVDIDVTHAAKCHTSRLAFRYLFAPLFSPRAGGRSNQISTESTLWARRLQVYTFR